MKQYTHYKDKNKRYPKPKTITVYKQKTALKAAYPEGVCFISQGKKLVWYGKLRPSAASCEYVVVVTWTPDCPPMVWVIGDNLEKLDDPNFPHAYYIDQEQKMVQICLYRYQEFNQYTFLDSTIIPWAKEWLFYYEMWLTTGEWLGGGEHPDESERRSGNEDNADTAFHRKREESYFKLLNKCYQLIMKRGYGASLSL